MSLEISSLKTLAVGLYKVAYLLYYKYYNSLSLEKSLL